MLRLFFLSLFLVGCVQQPPSTHVVLAPNQILVKPGDTVSGLAYKHGVSTRALSKVNRLRPPYLLVPGQVLILPESGYTQQDIAASFPKPVQRAPISSAPVFSISQNPPSKEEGNTSLTPKSLEPLPGLKPPSPARQGTKSSLDPQVAAELEKEESALVHSQKQTPKPPSLPQKNVSKTENAENFSWPVQGKIIQKYSQSGGARHDGMRIAVPQGMAVKAVQKGEVIYVGREVPDVGNLILVRHEKGWISAYGHVDHAVRKGDRVSKGQILGKVSPLDKGTSLQQPQLYFEMRKEGGKPVDPLSYLGA